MGKTISAKELFDLIGLNFDPEVRPKPSVQKSQAMTQSQADNVKSILEKKWTELRADDFWDKSEAFYHLSEEELAYYAPAFMQMELKSSPRFFQAELTPYQQIFHWDGKNKILARTLLASFLSCWDRSQRGVFREWLKWQGKYRSDDIAGYLASQYFAKDFDLS